MRKKTMIAAAIAGGTVMTALIAGPSIAAGSQDGQSGQSGQHQGNGQSQSANGRGSSGMTGGHTGVKPLGHGKAGRQGQGHGKAGGQDHGKAGGLGHGKAGGPGAGPDSGSTAAGNVAAGTMTEQQKAELAYMAEEELVAHDLYTAFAGLYDTPVFSRVASSESNHLDAVRNLMERYGVSDPTVDHVAGVFSDDSLQNLYDGLLAKGRLSQADALEAGRTVEKTDIASLTAAAKGATTSPDAKTVFTRLLEASKHHLSAFGG